MAKSFKRRVSLREVAALAAPLAILVLLTPSPVAAARKRVFVTSVACSSPLGPCSVAPGDDKLAAANHVCEERAAAAGLSPNGEVFRAWLSDADTDAYCNVLGLSGHRGDVVPCGTATLPTAGPWERVDGLPFAESIDDLVGPGHSPLVTVSVDELGALVTNGNYLSGSDIHGAYAPSMSCQNWVVTDGSANWSGGNADLAGQDWISGSALSCNTPARVVCFETGAGDPLRYPSAPGALAFVSASFGAGELELFPGSGGLAGLAGADAACQSSASAAHLPSPTSFVAWLSDSGDSAASRMQIDGPWKRVDGIEIASSLADLTDSRLRAPIIVTESGEISGSFTWTGTIPDGTVAPETCDGWLSAEAPDSGMSGRAWRSDSSWTQGSPWSCAFEASLFCFSNRIILGWDNFELGDFRRWSDVAPGP